MDDKIRSVPFWLRGLVVTLVLTFALSWMAYERVALLQNGKEIVLKTRPVDPRSLFRGHYARLHYDIATLSLADFSTTAEKWKRHEKIFVVLKKDKDGFWVADTIAKERPVAVAGKITIAGRLKNTYGKKLRIRYGIEKYFAAKKDALELERIDRTKTPVGVILRISTKGQAAISGLMIDGKKIYDEPLY